MNNKNKLINQKDPLLKIYINKDYLRLTTSKQRLNGLALTNDFASQKTPKINFK